MLESLSALSLWLHGLATVVLIGHFVLLRLIYLPALTGNAANGAGGALLSEISKRSRSWLYAALIVFALTGTLLTLVSPNYLGLGNFGSPWTLLMLLKHLVVVGMLAAGAWYNAIWRVGPMLSSSTGATQAFARFRQYVDLMIVAGLLVLLLTAISQVL